MNRPEKNSQGAAMVELALLLPLLLILLFGITEMGRALYQQSILTKAVDSATRMLSRSYNTIDVANGCTTLENWDTAKEFARQLLIYGDVDGGTEPLLDGLDLTEVNVESRSLQDYDKEVCIISVNAEAPFQPIVTDIYFGFPSFNLRASAEQRYIGE